jgi:tRNA-binding EMAP/Myf-like protein
MPKKTKESKPKAKAAVEEKVAEGAAEPWTCAECAYEHEGEEAASLDCVACETKKPVAEGGEADAGEDRFAGYKCGVVQSVEDIADKLKACTIDVGAGEGNEVTIVTNATNVGEGTRVVVATVGALVGEEKLQKRAVGGRMSQGMLCDAPMLGWTGGGAGAAALVPDSFEPGSRPPERRPRMDGK